jgi:vacuolar-type H+-ATPase subunit I/STV1
MTGSEDMTLIMILPLTILFWAWVVWAILDWRKTRHKSQLQNKIVDKFQSVQEFNDFLQSKEGNKFLNSIKFNGMAPKEKLLSSLSKGVILVTLGIALILVGQIFPDEMKYFIAFGIVFIALGVGFVISMYISYTLSKKWGIIDEKDLP